LFAIGLSLEYLALDEIYHPFRAAIPNNPTLQSHESNVKSDPIEEKASNGTLTLSGALFQETWTLSS